LKFPIISCGISAQVISMCRMVLERNPGYF